MYLVEAPHLFLRERWVSSCVRLKDLSANSSQPGCGSLRKFENLHFFNSFNFYKISSSFTMTVDYFSLFLIISFYFWVFTFSLFFHLIPIYNIGFSRSAKRTKSCTKRMSKFWKRTGPAGENLELTSELDFSDRYGFDIFLSFKMIHDPVVMIRLRSIYLVFFII